MMREISCSFCRKNTIGTATFETGLAHQPYICGPCLWSSHSKLMQWGIGQGHPFYDWMFPPGTHMNHPAHYRIREISLDNGYADVLRSVLAAKRKVS